MIVLIILCKPAFDYPERMTRFKGTGVHPERVSLLGESHLSSFLIFPRLMITYNLTPHRMTYAMKIFCPKFPNVL